MDSTCIDIYIYILERVVLKQRIARTLVFNKIHIEFSCVFHVLGSKD